MLIFLDIETVPIVPKPEQLTPAMQQHWNHKKQFLRLSADELQNDQLAFIQHAGIFAEWSKVVCIGLGYRKGNKIRLKALSGHDEKKILEEFIELISDFSQHEEITFCGHNIKEFDIPFICRRLIVNNFKLPKVIDLAGLKPWENNHIDTMALWRFGEYKRYTSLSLIADTLGIENPKQDLNGSMVASEYYRNNGLENITNYCLNDVYTTALVYFKLSQQFSIDLEKEFV